MRKNLFLLLASLALFCNSCSEDLGKSDIVIPEWDITKLSKTDRYIYDNFTQPFNIQVNYKWDASETDMDKTLVPPQEEMVIPFLEVVKKIWMDPYIGETDSVFVKQYFPKQLLLIGSPSYNTDGSITQGTAEGGKKIVLFEINDFNPTYKTLIRRYSRTLFHEFAHILHQSVEYATDYQNITPAYTSGWYLVASDTKARQDGFITRYAMSAPSEDFAEMVAQMLIYTEDEWNELLAEAGDNEALLRKKEKMVISYMKNNWNIEMEHFRKVTTNAMKEVIEDEDNPVIN